MQLDILDTAGQEEYAGTHLPKGRRGNYQSMEKFVEF
jgi:hypothetical protein